MRNFTLIKEANKDGGMIIFNIDYYKQMTENNSMIKNTINNNNKTKDKKKY